MPMRAGKRGKTSALPRLICVACSAGIQVNVKKVYVGSSDVGVYLLHSGGELLLGRIFIRSGAGEYRTQVQSENVDGSGLCMEDCYGLTIHDVENAWQSYTTIWEDAVAQTAEIQLAEVTAENLRKQKEEQERKEKEQKEREAQKQAGLGRNEVQLSGKETVLSDSEVQIRAAELERMTEKGEAAEPDSEPLPEPVPEPASESISKQISKSDLESVMPGNCAGASDFCRD